ILAQLPNVDMRSARFDRLLNDKPELLRAVSDNTRDSVVDQLLATQRLFKLTADPEHVEELMVAGYRSAGQVAVHGRLSFGRRFAETFGSVAEAERIHDTATRRIARIDVLTRAYQEIAHEPMPRVMRGNTIKRSPADTGTTDEAQSGKEQPDNG